MPTVDELLNDTIESQVCTIDPDTRVINVPACYKEFGVEADEKVNRIKFQCPKIVGDNIDLATFNLYINYMNARGNYNAYLVDDVTVSGDNITFSWLLSRHVTEKSGTVNYIVCAKKSDDTSVLNEWNTKVATATVGVGLEATTVVEEQNADVIEQILIKLNSSKNDAVTYTEQDLTSEQKAQARANIGAQDLQVAKLYYMWINGSSHTNDIYSIAGTGVSIGIITGEGQGGVDSDGNGLATPVVVIFGSVNRGYVDALAISRLGGMYQTTLNLMSCPEPVWHKIKNLTLKDDSTLAQQIMSSDPTDDMHIVTKNYTDTMLRNLASATKDYVDKAINSIPSEPNVSLNVTGATVGQTVKISAVDANGVPTAWVPVNMGSGEKWEKIAEIVIPDGAAETNALTINKDINGEQFSLIKARICVKQPKYTGDSSIPSFSFAMINGKTSGRIRPLAYTSAFRMPSKSVITGSVYEVDVSGAQQIETVYRSGNGGWSDDSSSDFVTYSNPYDEYSRYVADTLWAKPITSIGGAGMLIYPGCRYVLYGVRE